MQPVPATLMRGVTVKWLVDFTNRHRCWNMPTYQVRPAGPAWHCSLAPSASAEAAAGLWQVVEDVVKPATKELSCRYVDLPNVKASGIVGEAKASRLGMGEQPAIMMGV